MHACLIAMGGNLQISRQVFEDSLRQLQFRGCTEIRMSRVLKTRPVGAEAGSEFLNAAAVLKTDQSPEELLRTLHEIEAMFQRVRTRHWGPRTLDLDLILFGELISNIPQLVIPHPAMWYRRFVLEPAIDVAADMIHPLQNESVADLHRRLMCRPLRLEICGTQSAAESGVLDAVLQHLRDTGSNETDWNPADVTSEVGCDSFARIILEQEETLTTWQPLHQKRREISVGGQTAADIVSQIEQLRTAMLG